MAGTPERSKFDERDIESALASEQAEEKKAAADREPLSEDEFWQKLDDFDALSRAEKVSAFADLGRRNLDIIKGWYSLAGYDFFVTDPKAMKAGFAVTADQETVKRAYSDSIIASGARDEAAEEAGRESVRRSYELLKDNILSEYKIHLQPERKQIGPVLRRLMDMLKRPENADIKGKLCAFKIKMAPGGPGGEVFPEVVIYPAAGAETDASGKSSGRRNMERVLAAVLEAVRDMEPEAQKDSVPRYNARINDLVHVAQSGGDFKNFLKHHGLLDEYFDASTNYGFSRSERPPAEAPGSQETEVIGIENDPEIRAVERRYETLMRFIAADIRNLPEISATVKEIEKQIERLRTTIKDMYRQTMKVGSIDEVHAIIAKQRPLKGLRSKLQMMHDELKKHDVQETLEELRRRPDRDEDQPSSGRPKPKPPRRDR